MKLFKIIGVALITSAPLWADDAAYAEIYPGSKITYPGSPVDTSYIVNPTADYTYNNYCGDFPYDGNIPNDKFQITGLRHRLRDDKDTHFILPDEHHYYCTQEVTYTVSCNNGLSYKGKMQWETNPEWYCGFYGCSDSETDWQDDSLSSYDPLTHKVRKRGAGSSHCGETYTVPTEIIAKLWNGRRVEYPAYKGGAKVLSRPVIFVAGHNSNYTAWGAVPKGEEKATNAAFLAGEVTGYTQGSLPDVLSRNQGLAVSADSINQNGIYFFNAPYNWVDTAYKQPLPDWKDDDARNSISFALYKYLENTLDRHFGVYWKSDTALQVDMVAHSQGGLTIREMLRGLRANASHYPSGPANPANHIRKVVTVNTPHFGSELGDKKEVISSKYAPVAAFIGDIESQSAREAKGDMVYRSQVLMSANVKKDIGAFFNTGSNEALNAILGKTGVELSGSDGSVISALGIASGSVLGGTVGALGFSGGSAGAILDADVALRGANFGDYDLDITLKKFGGKLYTKTKRIDAAGEYRRELWNEHLDGEHLGTHSTFVNALRREGFPKKPDGGYIYLQPMYSSDVRGIRDFFFDQLTAGSKKLCADDDEDVEGNCLVVSKYLNAAAKSNSGVELKNISMGKWLGFFNDLAESWLKGSDILVSEGSQKFEDEYADEFHTGNFAAERAAGYLLPARTYSIYLSQVPDKVPFNMIPHGDVPTPYGVYDNADLGVHLQSVAFEGAPKKGLDLLCALDDVLCPAQDSGSFLKIPGGVSAATVPSPTGTADVSQQSLDVSGDFDLAPLYLSSGYQGMGALDGSGNYMAVVMSVPDTGVYLWYRTATGAAHAEWLTSAKYRWQVSLARSGDSLKAKLAAYSGERKEAVIPVALPYSARLVAFGDVGASQVAAVFAGTGAATFPETQAPVVVPPGSADNPGDVFVVHRETRGDEYNASRPRFFVVNKGDSTIYGFKVAYYFTADPARVPEAVIDYPHYPIEVEHLGGDQWRFVLDLSSESLPPHFVHPGKDGYQIRLHLKDWTAWNPLRDSSENLNAGEVAVNDRIVVYDARGKILWGKVPAAVADSAGPGTVSVKLDYADAGGSEANTWKPEFTVKNTGTVPLKNFRVGYYIRKPEGKSFEMPVSDWYTPNGTPSFRAVSGGVYLLTFDFDSYILYPGESAASGNVGVHLADWSAIDKTSLGMVIWDENGNVIYGTPWNGKTYAAPLKTITFNTKEQVR